MSSSLPATRRSAGVTSLGDYGASLLRTAVPAAWGTVVAALLAWALPRVPGDVGTALSALLQSELVLGVLVTVATAAWYALARWLEPRLPAWLTRLVLGSAAAPTYARVNDDGAAVITTLAPPDPYPLPGHWSNGDPVHLIVDGAGGRRVAPNLNGATWITDDQPRHRAE